MAIERSDQIGRSSNLVLVHILSEVKSLLAIYNDNIIKGQKAHHFHISTAVLSLMQFCCSTNKYATTKTNAILSKWITMLEQQENMACSTQIRECMSSNTVLKESWHLICTKTVKLDQHMLQSPHSLNNPSNNKSNWMNTTLINRNLLSRTKDYAPEKSHDHGPL